jgi:hypothetical protein
MSFDGKSKAAVPLRLRRALVLLHVWFWLVVACLSFIMIFTSIYERGETPQVISWIVVLCALGLLVGRVGFYVSLWRVIRGTYGKSPIIWVGACLLFWPFADLIAYVSIATQPKEWAARPDPAAT